jgi:uncharacterized protein YjgD (DUF1641 family)
MNRCSKTGLTDKNYRTILDVLNMFDPNDVAKVCPKMATSEFMQEVLEAFETVLNYVERTQDDLDRADYAEADKQRDAEDRKLKDQEMKRLIHDMYIHSLS